VGPDNVHLGVGGASALADEPQGWMFLIFLTGLNLLLAIISIFGASTSLSSSLDGDQILHPLSIADARDQDGIWPIGLTCFPLSAKP
jgi:hypothetical protein